MTPLPLTVLTGFLGSGKTTILRHALRDPALAGTAVIVNEFGAVGLDHDLLESAEEDLVALSTGCLCCAVRGDLARTIGDLLARRAAGAIAFERLVIETSGLADPAPIVQALALDPAPFRSAVVTAAMAPGVNTYVFANMYGVAKRVAASAVLIGTGLTIVTSWLWLAVLP